jgi:hypothetical protein
VFSLAGLLSFFISDGRPLGINIVGIGMDGEGMRPDLLDRRLSSWADSEGQKPKVAYIVPYYTSPIVLTKELDRIQVERACSFNDAKTYTQSSKSTTF